MKIRSKFFFFIALIAVTVLATCAVAEMNDAITKDGNIISLQKGSSFQSDLPPVGSRDSHTLDEVIISEDFESYANGTLPPGWTQVDLDEQTNPNPFAGLSVWQVFGLNGYPAHGGSKMVANAYNGDGSQNDDWLILPQQTLGTPITLTYWHASQDEDYLEEYEVRVSTTGNAPADFTDVLLDVNGAPNAWTQVSIDLSDYDGIPFYIAFWYNSTDKFVLKIDDLVLEGVAGPTGTIDGTVTNDETSNPIADVDVAVDGTVRATTNATGQYEIIGVAVGTYTLTFSHDDYEPETVTDVSVTEGVTTTVNVTMVPLPQELDPPTNVQADVDDNCLVTLTWDHPSLESNIDTLIYDGGVPTDGYSYVGFTMSSQMSPDGPCQVLALLYYTMNSGGGAFNAEVYNWTGSQPGTTLLFTTLVTEPVDDDWEVVDISAADLTVDGDFMVGFGSINDVTFFGFDGNDNNGRSWDFSGTSWSQWNETYFARAIVEYTDGTVAILDPVERPVDPTVIKATAKTRAGRSPAPQPIRLNLRTLDDFLNFNILRDGTSVGTTTEGTYQDQLPGIGTYSYVIQAVYDEGTANSDPEEVICPEAIEESQIPGIPEQFDIVSAYPNPFNPVTTLTIALPNSQDMRVAVYNNLGQQVAVLAQGSYAPGYYDVTFDASNMPSGIYFARLESGAHFTTYKMVLMK